MSTERNPPNWTSLAKCRQKLAPSLSTQEYIYNGSLTATNRDAASQTVLSLTEIHICFLLSLFLSILLMFSPENFQMNCVRPVKTASQLSYSPGAMQLPAHAHPRLLKVAVAC